MTEVTEYRAQASSLLNKYLGTADLSVQGLMSCSASALGQSRADRLFEVVRSTWLSQRYWGLSIVASLVAGTRLIGQEWWTSRQRSPWPLGSDLNIDMSPDEVLFGPDTLSHGRSRVLTHLEDRISEEVAVQAWGMPLEFVDLNSPEPEDRLKQIPPGVQPGDRLVVAYDPGCVIDVVVEMRPGERLGTRLDLESSRWSVPSEVWFAWCTAFPKAGPFDLPDEDPSPYDSRLDSVGAAELKGELVALGIPEPELGRPWETKRDLCAELARLENRSFEAPYRWMRKAEALLDGRESAD